MGQGRKIVVPIPAATPYSAALYTVHIRTSSNSIYLSLLQHQLPNDCRCLSIPWVTKEASSAVKLDAVILPGGGMKAVHSGLKPTQHGLQYMTQSRDEVSYSCRGIAISVA
jgi:hypothetical protein